MARGQDNFGEALVVMNETERSYTIWKLPSRIRAYEIFGKIFFYNNHTIGAIIEYLRNGKKLWYTTTTCNPCEKPMGVKRTDGCFCRVKGVFTPKKNPI